jgi:hypothetical protein
MQLVLGWQSGKAFCKKQPLLRAEEGVEEQFRYSCHPVGMDCGEWVTSQQLWAVCMHPSPYPQGRRVQDVSGCPMFACLREPSYHLPDTPPQPHISPTASAHGSQSGAPIKTIATKESEGTAAWHIQSPYPSLPGLVPVNGQVLPTHLGITDVQPRVPTCASSTFWSR